jgi:hypothetical protein
MQETGQQIRANIYTCADRGTLYTIWHMQWWRLLLELRLLLLSTAYSGWGPRINPGSCRAPRTLILDPKARFCFRVSNWVTPGTGILRIHVQTLAPAHCFCCGKTGPGPHSMFLLTTQPEPRIHSPAPGAESLPGLLASLVRVIHEACRMAGDMICAGFTWYMWVPLNAKKPVSLASSRHA